MKLLLLNLPSTAKTTRVIPLLHPHLILLSFSLFQLHQPHPTHLLHPQPYTLILCPYICDQDSTCHHNENKAPCSFYPDQTVSGMVPFYVLGIGRAR
ncbi:putative mitochondrial protein (mitochondrion) [Arabidopsis thaliana]